MPRGRAEADRGGQVPLGPRLEPLDLDTRVLERLRIGLERVLVPTR